MKKSYRMITVDCGDDVCGNRGEGIEEADDGVFGVSPVPAGGEVRSGAFLDVVLMILVFVIHAGRGVILPLIF